MFSDVVMPDISGIILAAKLYELLEPPEVVLLSGIPGFSLEVWKIRAYGFILKPYTKAQIIKMADWYKREHKTENQLLGGDLPGSVGTVFCILMDELYFLCYNKKIMKKDPFFP